MKKIHTYLTVCLCLMAITVSHAQVKKISTPCWSARLEKTGTMDTVTVTVRGKVYDQWGHPISWAQLHLGSHTASTDESGNFSFRQIPAGKYQLQVYGHCLPARKKISLKPGSITQMDVYVIIREEHPNSMGVRIKEKKKKKK